MKKWKRSKINNRTIKKKLDNFKISNDDKAQLNNKFELIWSKGIREKTWIYIARLILEIIVG